MSKKSFFLNFKSISSTAFLLLFSTIAFAQTTVSIPCTGATNPNSGRIEDQSGSYVKTYGYLRHGVSAVWRGWARFDVPSYVPAGATITAAEVDFYVQTSSGAASSNYLRFFTGNTGTMTAGAVWSAIGNTSAHEASNADLNPAGAKTRAINATGVTYLNTNKASILNLGFSRGSGNFGFYIYGSDGTGNGSTDATRKPVLRITYTLPCTAPTGGTISGTNAVCSGAAGVAYSISGVSGTVTSYTWAVPAGAAITAGAGTANVTVTWGSTSGDVTCAPQNTASCVETALTYPVTVTVVPAPTGITGTTTICSGTKTTLRATGGDANTKWFTGSCGGTQVGTGDSFTTPNLSTATTYFAANEACGGITTCASTTVNVTAAAVAPTAITGTTTICSGTKTTLKATGGNATTKWFTGSCGGTQVGTGDSFTTPNLTTATTYYAANEVCATLSSCASTTVTITTAATAPTGITGTTAICSGTTTTLKATGGNATTKWFTGSCGGTQVGTGDSFTTPNLTTATTYYAANEVCATLSACASTTVTITTAATAPTGITGTTAICTNTSTTLTATGGNATTKWFTGSCGGTQVGIGASYTTQNLTTATTYYAANEVCATLSTCASTTVTITTAATAPTAITGTTAICSGTSTTLTATGGNATTKWFTGSCGGTQVGTGASYTTLNLTTATTYYAANEVCATLSTCASTTVTITTAATAPTAITGTTAICTNTSTILTATGGNATTKWFTGSCGGTQVGTGASYTSPNLSNATTYYAANEVCATLSTCANTSVTLNNVPAQPDSIKGAASLCANSTASYSTTNVNGLTYAWSLPVGWSGSSTTNQISITAGSNSGTITVTAGNNCGASNARTLSVTVNALPTVALTAFTDVCATAAPFALTGGTPAGGTYAINGTTATNFNPAGSGRTDTITYRYTNANTCSASASQIQKVKICSGIEENNSNTLSEIKLYPNPVASEMMVSLDKGIYAITIIDAVGRTIESFNWIVLQQEEKKVNTTNLSSGVYFMNFNSKSKASTTLKFIKE